MWVCVVVVVSGLASAVPVGAQVLRVEWTGQRLSVAAQNVPLSTVLTEVARQTGSSVVGLEKATESVTLDITSATLRDGLRTMLADKNYIYIQRYSETTHAYDRVKLTLYRTSAAMASAKPCAAAGSGCDDTAPGVVAFDGALAGPSAERFPRGPSPAEAEVARLSANGAFNPDAAEGSLLTLSKSADANVRIRALQTLALQNSRLGYDAVNAALNDDHPFVRAEAVELALLLGGPGASAARELGTLANHRDPAIRVSAALALGEEPGEDSDVLLRRLLDDDDASVRSAAAQQLQQKESHKDKQQKVKR